MYIIKFHNDLVTLVSKRTKVDILPSDNIFVTLVSKLTTIYIMFTIRLRDHFVTMVCKPTTVDIFSTHCLYNKYTFIMPSMFTVVSWLPVPLV